MRLLTFALFTTFWNLCLLESRAASETPPEGPPWTKDFLEAHRIAFEQGKPIFVYSTKTH